MFFKRKKKYPENAKYKIRDYVNFRYRNELYFGYIYDAKINNEGEIIYTIQIAGQCPALIYDYKEKVSKQYNESYKTLTKFVKKLPCTFFCTLIVILSMYRKRVGSYVYI